MNNDTVVLDKTGMEKALTRIAHEIVEGNKTLDRLVVIGIKLRGDILARRLVKKINTIAGKTLEAGALDITLYRDDLSQVAEQPIMRATEIDFDITGKYVVLVDDVLYTGRTIRCALDALIDLGRPQCIKLACLVDRGHRELPIKADYVGKNIPTSADDTVEVMVEEIDSSDRAVLIKRVV